MKRFLFNGLMAALVASSLGACATTHGARNPNAYGGGPVKVPAVNAPWGGTMSSDLNSGDNTGVRFGNGPGTTGSASGIGSSSPSGDSVFGY